MSVPAHKPTTNNQKNNMKYIIISTNDDSYGESTDAQIAAVKTRTEIICREMKIPYRYDDTQLNNTDDSHDATELVFELAAGCRSKIPLEFVDAVATANSECPIRENLRDGFLC